MATKGFGVGASLTLWGINNSGYCQGTSGALANGATSEMGQLIGLEQFNVTMAKARPIAIPGDNSLIGSVLLPPNTVSQGTLMTSVIDPIFFTSPIGAIVDTESGVDLALVGVQCPAFKSLTVIINSVGQSASSGANGVPGYIVQIYPNVFFYPRANDNSQNGQALQFQGDIILSLFDRYPWGAQPTLVLNGFTRGTKMMPFWYATPWTIAGFVGDGTTLTMTLNNTPISDDGTSVRVYDNGTALVYGTGSGKYQVSAQTLTFGTAPVAGHRVEVFYTFNPTC